MCELGNGRRAREPGADGEGHLHADVLRVAGPGVGGGALDLDGSPERRLFVFYEGKIRGAGHLVSDEYAAAGEDDQRQDDREDDQDFVPTTLGRAALACLWSRSRRRGRPGLVGVYAFSGIVLLGCGAWRLKVV